MKYAFAAFPSNPFNSAREPDRSTQASECFIVRMLSATSCPDVCARIKAC
ncbi:Uncharacterised protein [Mycobacterium tuberculosis]|uniref:Uncharacterized protein n=1 Tax=Mycobacterium tuberculosis TaxID=1773 RepID=A0A0T7PS49_MYCTX|nr:Uncharacterised protein [Mycobacterium tuberculosis]COV27144.1 Uncharacterised protein [Mycobacterium tuberculosis]CPA00660.1 Uncharacterised protein [Mycobacterium tuberculosis]